MQRRAKLTALLLALASTNLFAMESASPSRSVPLSAQNSISPGGFHSDTDQQQKDLDNRLIMAVLDGRVDKALVLLQRGANANFRTVQGKTPLMHAAGEGLAEMCALLIDYGADPAAIARFGYTALFYAARKGRVDAALTLLSAIPLSERDRILEFSKIIIATQCALKKGGLITPRDLHRLITQPLIDELIDEQMARVDRLLTAKNTYGEIALNDVVNGNHPKMLALLDPLNQESRALIRHELERNIRRILFTRMGKDTNPCKTVREHDENENGVNGN